MTSAFLPARARPLRAVFVQIVQFHTFFRQNFVQFDKEKNPKTS